MTLHVPRYLINKYVAMVWKYTPLEGPAFSVWMPRVIPRSRLLWSYASCEDITTIQRLSSEGKASPYDLSLLGGNALSYTATHGHANLDRFLIQEGADADIADNFGRKAIEAF